MGEKKILMDKGSFSGTQIAKLGRDQLKRLNCPTDPDFSSRDCSDTRCSVMDWDSPATFAVLLSDSNRFPSLFPLRAVLWLSSIKGQIRAVCSPGIVMKAAVRPYLTAAPLWVIWWPLVSCFTQSNTDKGSLMACFILINLHGGRCWNPCRKRYNFI